MPRLPAQLAALLAAIASGLPQALAGNLVAVYLYGSLTQRAFDPRVSDVDALVVTRRNLSAREFDRLAKWLTALAGNPWTAQLQLSILRQSTLLREDSGACLFQHGQLTRSGSDGNPIPWLNALASGRVLYGRPVAEVVPPVTVAPLAATLVREAAYLRDELADTRSTWRNRPFSRAYAVLTVCRILYTQATGSIASKPVAGRWAQRHLPERWHGLVRAALADRGPDSRAVLPLRAVRALVGYCEQTLEHGGA
jgi:hypothetical protein